MATLLLGWSRFFAPPLVCPYDGRLLARYGNSAALCSHTGRAGLAAGVTVLGWAGAALLRLPQRTRQLVWLVGLRGPAAR